MPMTLEIVYTFLSIQNTNAYKVLGDSHKYFTVVSHICAFISMIPKNIPCLAVIFVITALNYLLQFINFLYFAMIFVLSDQ